jgi:PAS domain-containing protein
VYAEALDEGETERKTLYVSPQIEDMLGYSRREWTEDPKLWERLLHPEDRERALAD